MDELDSVIKFFNMLTTKCGEFSEPLYEGWDMIKQTMHVWSYSIIPKPSFLAQTLKLFDPV